MDWHMEANSGTRRGRLLQTFSQDLESVIFAVITFLSGGILLFIFCFFTTKCMQCYKARIRRNRRRAMGHDDDDDELNAAVLSGAFDASPCDEEESRLVGT